MSGEIRVVDPSEGGLSEDETVSGLVDRTVFHVEDYRLVLSRVEGETSWHSRRGAVYGWIRSGHGRIGYGHGAGADLEAGDFLHVPSGTVHRFTVEGDPIEILSVVTAGHRIAPREAPPPDADPEPSVVEPDDLRPTVESPNLVRETPFPDEDVLQMRVRAAGGAAAGWHHHGDNVYFGYTVDGPSETEYGPAGQQCARIDIGECFHVPPNLVHRDTNPADTAHTGIIWLCGGQPWVVNVDGPR